MNSDKRPHGGGDRIFHGDYVMWYWPVSSIAFCCTIVAMMLLLIFLQRTHNIKLTMLFYRPDNPKNIPFSWGLWTPFNTWLLGPIRVSITIGSAIFAGLTYVTNRQKDRLRYSVCSNTPHVAIAMMWPNNNYKLETVSIAEPLQNRQHVRETPNAVNTRREREWEGELKARREEEGN